MYTEFFGLNEKPFAITPDPRYLYMSARHTDALAHLIYGISESGGFIQLTGEVGTGKTTLVRSLLEQLPAKVDIALILSPQLTTFGFLQAIADELGYPVPRERSVKGLVDNLNTHLFKVHANGRRVVLIVDEAQTLSPELLEQVRLLTNLETTKQKLLQIILIGQPELRELLDRPEMRQIAQRITGRYHLEPLSKDDTTAYVQHRLRVAGAQSSVFTKAAMRNLYRLSRGIPRLINVIADRALLAAYTQDRRTVDRKLVSRAAAEVFGDRSPAGGWWPWVGIGVGITLFALATTNLWQTPTEPAATLLLSATAAAPASTPATAAPLPDPAAAAPEPPPPPPTLTELLQDPEFVADTDSSIGELLGLWGASYDAARGEPCVQAEEQGLRCRFQGGGSLGELRRVNWPTIVSLVDDHGAEHPILIASLGYDQAGVIAHGKTFKLPLAELTFHWYGDHLLLWRPGDAPLNGLVPGERNAGVLWLRATLAQIRGETASDASTLYDAALERRVREYQRERMLTVDGVVGARTQIAMLADLGIPGTPLLRAGH